LEMRPEGAMALKRSTIDAARVWPWRVAVRQEASASPSAALASDTVPGECNHFFRAVRPSHEGSRYQAGLTGKP
jgi:hypothetical protein